jgi:uncharacterized protein (TIGR03382 family)
MRVGMNPSRSLASFSVVALLGLSTVLAGCGSDESAGSFNDSRGTPGNQNGGQAPPSSPSPTGGEDGTRAVEEADIVQVDGALLYAMSKTGGVSIVDISSPNRLTLMGPRVTLPGTGFEMYKRGNIVFTMANNAVSKDGTILPAYDPGAPANNGTNNGAGIQQVTNGSAIIAPIDVSNPAQPRKLPMFKVPGEIADSRVVGDVIYIVSYESGSACWSCSNLPRTVVTSFNIADPNLIKKVDQVGYVAPSSTYTAWKRSVASTNERLYVAGPDYKWSGSGTPAQSIIQVLDVTDPTGKLGIGSTIPITGQITSRWQMDEYAGYLRVIAQRDAASSTNGSGAPLLNTFKIANSSSLSPAGSMEIKFPIQEKLKSVRFDGTRAYAITFRETDPLFTIDLSDQTKPLQKGQLQMPGFVHHMEPRGNRLIGIGFDRTMPGGYINVSLFDVTDLATPKMLDRVAFGDYLSELPEDQNRIHKAFRIFDEANLMVVPYTTKYSRYYGQSSCDPSESGVQLIDWRNDTLMKRSLLPVRGNARRAFLFEDRMIAVSDTNVRAFSLQNWDASIMTADLVIGQCGTYSNGTPYPGYPTDPGYPYNNGYYGNDYDYASRDGGYLCSTSAKSFHAPMSAAGTAALGLVALAFLVRRRKNVA